MTNIYNKNCMTDIYIGWKTLSHVNLDIVCYAKKEAEVVHSFLRYFYIHGFTCQYDELIIHRKIKNEH